MHDGKEIGAMRVMIAPLHFGGYGYTSHPLDKAYILRTCTPLQPVPDKLRYTIPPLALHPAYIDHRSMRKMYEKASLIRLTHGVSRNHGEQRRGAKAMAVRQEHGWREDLSVTRMREGSRESRVGALFGAGHLSFLVTFLYG